MIRQELRRTETCFRLKVVRYHRFPGTVGIARRRSDVGGKRDDVDGILLPAYAGTDHQAFFVGLVFQDLCELRPQSDGAEFGRFLKDHPKIPGLHGGAAEFSQQRLLPESVAKLVPPG